MAPGYSQQVLDELVTTSESQADIRRILDATQKDQWKIGKRQLKLEELRLKVDLGILSSEQATRELEGLPELVRTKVDHSSYQSVYECWVDEQERIAEERRQNRSGSEEEAEVEGETMRE